MDVNQLGGCYGWRGLCVLRGRETFHLLMLKGTEAVNGRRMAFPCLITAAIAKGEGSPTGAKRPPTPPLIETVLLQLVFEIILSL